MAERSPMWPEPSRFEPYEDTRLTPGPGSDEDWSRLRELAAEPAVRARRTRFAGRALLMVPGAAVLGALLVGLYFLAVQPSVYFEAPQAASSVEPASPGNAARSHPRKRTGTHHEAAPRNPTASTPAPAAASDPRMLELTWPEVAPPLNAEVVSGNGPVPVRITSPTYQIDVRSGTVLAIRNHTPNPGASDPISRVQPADDANPAQLSDTEGVVVLRVWTNEKGDVREVQVVSGSPPLAAAAVDAVKQWRFAAATPQQQPLVGMIAIRIIFSSTRY